MKKNWKTTLCGAIAVVLVALSTQFPDHADIFKGLATAIGALGLALAGDASNTVKAVLIALVFSFSTGYTNTAKAQAGTSYVSGWENVWLVAPAVTDGMLVSHNGVISANPRYICSDSAFTVVQADTNKTYIADTSTLSVYHVGSQHGVALTHKDSTGTYALAALHGKVTLTALYPNDSVAKIGITQSGIIIKNVGMSQSRISSTFSGSYTPDTANVIKYLVNTTPVLNYTVTDSIIEIYGYVSGVSSDSLTENQVDLTLPSDFDGTINGLTGICSVYSPAQTVKGNGVCIGSADKVRLLFYSSRKARADIYFRFSYRYI